MCYVFDCTALWLFLVVRHDVGTLISDDEHESWHVNRRFEAHACLLKLNEAWSKHQTDQGCVSITNCCSGSWETSGSEPSTRGRSLWVQKNKSPTRQVHMPPNSCLHKQLKPPAYLGKQVIVCISHNINYVTGKQHLHLLLPAFLCETADSIQEKKKKTREEQALSHTSLCILHSKMKNTWIVLNNFTH